MLKKGIGYISAVVAIVLLGAIGFSSCKSCNKKNDSQAQHVDSTSVPAVSQTPLNAVNLPQADSSLAPVLAQLMDDVFDASKKKDYTRLASYLIYRGPDMKRFGYTVFNPKDAYERGVVKVTAQVFDKWNSSCETKSYARIFSLAQQDGRDMVVMEVIFYSKIGVSRKFFGLLPINNDFKIVDVTSNLQVP